VKVVARTQRHGPQRHAIVAPSHERIGHQVDRAVTAGGDETSLARSHGQTKTLGQRTEGGDLFYGEVMMAPTEGGLDLTPRS
jgi:hypothetical protein